MVLHIAEERKRREIDPTLTVLHLCVLEATEDRKTDPEVRQRVQQMLDFMSSPATVQRARTAAETTMMRLMKARCQGRNDDRRLAKSHA